MKNGRSLAMAWSLSLLIIVLGGCSTSDSALREQGRGESYITGFHDGRHSGMKEAGNYLEHIVKDTQRFKDDTDYQAGWLAGEVEGIRIQQQANAASNSYNAGKAADKAGPHPHDAMKDAMKGVNTDDLKVLEK
jgi:hypothetical protein